VQCDRSSAGVQTISEKGDSNYALRSPCVGDAAAIHQMVLDSGVLDPNSLYAYLLICRDFDSTSIVAEKDGEIAGFVTGYIPPARPDSLFVWQVAVSDRHRRQGLAGRMLRELTKQSQSLNINYIEATISPSNTASRALFQSLANAFDTELRESEGFRTEDFGREEHEEEPVIRVGPVRPDFERK